MIIDLILWGAVGLVMSLGIYLVVETFILFPHEFTLKQVTNDVPIVIRTRAQEKRKKTGEVVWRLLWKRKEVSVPPDNARGITKKGKYYVEGWLVGDGQVQYESHPKVKENQVISTNQRIFLANQIQKAEKERVKGWKDIVMQLAIPITFGMMMLIAVIVGMTQWADINGPGLEFADKMVQLESQRTHQLEIIQEIKDDVQLIKTRAKISDGTEYVEEAAPN